MVRAPDRGSSFTLPAVEEAITEPQLTLLSTLKVGVTVAWRGSRPRNPRGPRTHLKTFKNKLFVSPPSPKL